MSQGTINLTDEAFASQRMTALSPITSNRGMHALQRKGAGIETNSQLVGKPETNQKRASRPVSLLLNSHTESRRGRPPVWHVKRHRNVPKARTMLRLADLERREMRSFTRSAQHRRVYRMVLLGTTSELQPKCRSSLPVLSRTEEPRGVYDQRPLSRRETPRLRSLR
jgi:hypothetical protein